MLSHVCARAKCLEQSGCHSRCQCNRCRCLYHRVAWQGNHRPCAVLALQSTAKPIVLTGARSLHPNLSELPARASLYQWLHRESASSSRARSFQLVRPYVWRATGQNEIPEAQGRAAAACAHAHLRTNDDDAKPGHATNAADVDDAAAGAKSAA